MSSSQCSTTTTGSARPELALEAVAVGKCPGQRVVHGNASTNAVAAPG